MRLSRIYVDLPLQSESVVTLPAEKAHYLQHVLRLKNGQQVVLFNGLDDKDYQATVKLEGRSKVSAEIHEASSKTNDPVVGITLIQALGKNEAIDLTIQKATELGASHIFLFNAERTQFPVREGKKLKKLSHWQKIMESACEQCGRNTLLDIKLFNTLTGCLQELEPGFRLLLDFNTQRFETLQVDRGENTFQLLVGPEGGLSEREKMEAKKEGFTGCSIGPRVLRMETAAISMLSLVQHRFGDM